MCGTNSLKSYGPKIRNALPFSNKTAENLKAFKALIKKWNGASCSCVICTQEEHISIILKMSICI